MNIEQERAFEQILHCVQQAQIPGNDWRRELKLIESTCRAALQSQPMPPEISRGLLGKIVDEVFDGAIEDASVIEDIYRVIARETALQSQDREDAERYRAWRKAVATNNGNFLRLVSNELPDWDEGPLDESRVDAAIDHARRIEGGGK